MEFFLGIIIMVVGVIVWVSSEASAKRKRIEEAERQYHSSLERLKRNPNDPDLREGTLEAGRHFSRLCREEKAVTIFDEMALMNDINAACARATVGQNTVGKVEVTNPIAVSGRSVAQEIERLGQLFLTGVITTEEFERGKTLFLGAPPDKAASAVELLQNLDALKKKGILSASEFNSKKWEILSERLIPGRLQAARLQDQTRSPRVAPAPVEEQIRVQCPACEEPMMIPSSSSGSQYTCPHCKKMIEVE